MACYPADHREPNWRDPGSARASTVTAVIGDDDAHGILYALKYSAGVA